MSSNSAIDKFREQIRAKNTRPPEVETHEESDNDNKESENSSVPQPTGILDYVFTPQEDITVYDLAKIMSFMVMSVSSDVFMKMPIQIRRHFIKFTG